MTAGSVAAEHAALIRAYVEGNGYVIVTMGDGERSVVPMKNGPVLEALDALVALVNEKDDLLNSPEVDDFDKGVPLEAAHQRGRWGDEHDDRKDPEEWFWLVGYLAGKALHAWRSGDAEKAKHHAISTAAVLRNWHGRIARAVLAAGQEDRRVSATESRWKLTVIVGPCTEEQSEALMVAIIELPEGRDVGAAVGCQRYDDAEEDRP